MYQYRVYPSEAFILYQQTKQSLKEGEKPIWHNLSRQIDKSLKEGFRVHKTLEEGRWVLLEKRVTKNSYKSKNYTTLVPPSTLYTEENDER